MLRFFFTFILFTNSLFLVAQKDTIHNKLGVETALSIGYTGFNAFLGPVYSVDQHQFYIGPKVALNSFYLPGHSHLGFNAGYRFYYLSSPTFSSFFSLDYQLSFFKLYDPYDHIDDKKKNNIQELVLGIGSQYSIQPHLHALLCFGFGTYREKFHTIVDDKANNDFYGYTVNARIAIQYDIFRK